MNIFALDNDPVKAAKYLCDKHIVKMPTESAQMVSTLIRLQYGSQRAITKANGERITYPYALEDETNQIIPLVSHPNHPCTQWLKQSRANFDWHLEYWSEMLTEYSRRYGKIHKAAEYFNFCLDYAPFLRYVGKGRTPFAQAVKEYTREDPVEAYRVYYIKDKARFAKWKTGNVPEWFKDR